MALAGLTAGFGMGPGVAPPLWRPSQGPPLSTVVSRGVPWCPPLPRAATRCCWWLVVVCESECEQVGGGVVGVCVKSSAY